MNETGPNGGESGEGQSQHKEGRSNSSLDRMTMEEKIEKDSSSSSSGFEELSPNVQSLSDDRPESKQSQKITDISMKITNDVASPNPVIKISLEINGVVYRGSLECDVKVEETESQKE